MVEILRKKMSWKLVWVAVALSLFCWGQSTSDEVKSLAASGFHLCVHNETKTVSFLVMHKFPFTMTRPCGGWLLWKTCTVTVYRLIYQTEYRIVEEEVTRCCDGYVQVGRYCALSANRTGEFTVKPGSCPDGDGLYAVSDECERDIDCPGWQKCCKTSCRFLCTEPASFTNYSENGGYRFNATVTVKTDFKQLISKEGGLLNHTRLLQAMVSGALQADISVCYLNSWPVHPYRTATSLLIDFSFNIQPYNITSKLYLLLKHIQEVSSVTVEDVNECVHPVLRQCSTQAECYNTVGSYHCTCHRGYVDIDPSNPGAHCIADTTVQNTTESPMSYTPDINTISIPTPTSTQDATDSTVLTAAVSNTSTTSYTSAQAPLWTHSAPHTSMSSMVETLMPTQISPFISNLQLANITGTSFCVYWSSLSQTNQTYQVLLSKGSRVISIWETSQTMRKVQKLKPGVLYTVTVVPHADGSQGNTLQISVKTDAKTLDATARITNIEFTAELWNTSSQAFKNLNMSIIDEIYQPLSPEVREMVDSGQVRIEVRNFSPGSVVVNFTIIFIPSESKDIFNTSAALIHSLMNSSKYTVDENNTSINDFDECASGENDCSLRATCANTWASYTCNCLDGFMDTNVDWPGRICEAILETTIKPLIPTILSLVSTAASTAPTSATSTTSSTPSATSTIAVTTFTTLQTTSTAPESTLVTPDTTPTAPESPSTAPETTSIALETISTAPTTTFIASATISKNLITTSAAQATNPTTPETSSTESSITAGTQGTVPTTSTTSHKDVVNASMLRAISVQCRVPAITVTVDRDFLDNSNINESSLYLGLKECGVNGGNATHAQLTVAWNECVTRIVHNETYYMVSVTLFNTMDPFMSPNGTLELPRICLEVPIMCTYMRSMLMSADLSSMGYNIIKDVIMGSGLFQVTVQLLNGTVPLPHNYSLSPEEAVVVEVSMNTSAEQIKVVIQTCWATPTQNPADTSRYIFLDNRCARNTYTKVLMNGNSSTSRLSVQIFSFVTVSMIYVHCQVQICVQVGSDTCVPDCVQRTSHHGNTIGNAFGSSGPLLVSDKETLEEKSNIVKLVGLSILGVGLSLIFIIGFACLFYYQRNRIGHYNFNVRPKQENFTYLVFNT